MIAILVIELLLLAAVCGLVLSRLASFKKTPVYALGSTWLGWLICFAIVFLVPIDVIDGDHTDCLENNNNDEELCPEPIAYLPTNVMEIQWRILYWGTFVLSWLIYPILQSYAKAGDFSIWERFVKSVKENVFLYIGMAFVGIIFVVALAAAEKLSRDSLLALIMALANAYGLVLVVLLMSYGLVDIPRYLMRKADREQTLAHYHAQATRFKESMESAEEELIVTLKIVKSIDQRVNQYDPFRVYVDKIIEKCRLEYDLVTHGEGDAGDITYAKLVALHARVIEDTHKVLRATCLYKMLLEKAFKIEDILKLKDNGGSPDKKLHYSFRPARAFKYANMVDTAEYYWEMYLHTIAYRILGVLSAVLSLLIVWCEVTLVVDKKKVDLSPFSHMIDGMHMEGFGKQLFCFIILAYMATCAYTTLFKLKLFNYYRLVPHRMSDPHSIMFSANYLCRLAAPLSFNFLQIVNETDSSFDTVMGEMGTFPKQFTVFFPIFVLVLCLFSIFNVWSRIGSMCCIKKLRYIPDDDHRLVTEGEQILKGEREKREGKGPTNKTFKESVKSSIKSATKKIFRQEDEEGMQTNNPSPDVPLTEKQKISRKYNRLEDGADTLPASSKFSNNTNNNNSSSGNNNSSSGNNNSNSNSDNRSEIRSDTRSNNSSSIPRGPRTNDDLLPATSRFAKPHNHAIVDMIHEAPDASRSFMTAHTPPPTSASGNKSAGGGKFSSLFGGGKKNDELGLLPR